MGAITKTAFLARVKDNNRWKIANTDPFYDDVDLMADDALIKHDERLTWDTIRMQDVYPVLLLIGVMIHQARASHYSEEYAVSGMEGSIDRAMVVSTSLQMADALQREYDTTIMNREITVGEITKFDTMIDKRTPEGAVIPPLPLVITAQGGVGKIEIQWSEPVTNGFRRFNVYALKGDEITTIIDTYTDTKIIEGYHPTVQIYEKQARQTRLKTVDAGTYYIVVTLEDYNKHVAASNEVVVSVT